MKTRFFRLAPPQQIMVASVLAVGLILVVTLGVLKPLHSWRATSLAEQQELQRELDLVQTLARELSSLRQASPERSGERRSLSALVDQSLQGRPFQPARIQLNEAGQIQLRLENVVFDDALSWLQELENYPGVLASALSVSREQSGRVSLGLTLQQL